MPTTTGVPPATPLATLQGVCKQPAGQNVCQTVLTREDLDRYGNLSTADIAEASRGRLAVEYARTAAFSAFAEKQGLEKDPALVKELAAQLELTRMRILSAAYLRKLQMQTAMVSEPEIQKYYEQHRSQYEQAQVQRLSVPVSAPTEGGRPLERAVIKAKLEALRGRAAAGEDLDLLQREAYKDLHIQAIPPRVNLTTLRRISTQGDEAKAFDLEPGELSGVLDLAAAVAIVKVQSKEPVPLETVRQEIGATLRAEVMQKEIRTLAGNVSTQFNLQYLGMPSQPDIFGPTPVRPVTASRAVLKGRSHGRRR